MATWRSGRIWSFRTPRVPAGQVRVAAQPSAQVRPQPVTETSVSSPRTGSVGRVVAGVVLGCVLGLVGLPRLDLSAVPFSAAQQSVSGSRVSPGLVQDEPEPIAKLPTAASAETIPLAAPVSTAAPVVVGPRVMIAERFGAPLAGWPNDPQGTAWFGDGAFRLQARQPGRFVAVGVPVPGLVGDAIINAQFRKIGGPPGGGYGLIVRDQSPASARDSRGQDGQYLVLEVGDRGDVGIWQRDQTRWIDIVPWTRSEVVHRDMQTNALTVSTHGAMLRFEVNGERVAEVTYDGLPQMGGVGIFVGGDLNQVALEWLRIEG
jgi:hypothetical protein